jgi:hypothetical protein
MFGIVALPMAFERWASSSRQLSKFIPETPILKNDADPVPLARPHHNLSPSMLFFYSFDNDLLP